MNALTVHDIHPDLIERRWRQQLIADLPDAADFARELPGPVALALAQAWHDHRAQAWRVRTPADAIHLRRWGLCDFPSAIGAGLLLTNFGAEVRRHVLALDRGT
jgi:hypothetical protein